MKKFRIAAILMAAALAVIPSTGCRCNSTKKSSSSGAAGSGYAGLEDVGTNTKNVKLGEEAVLNDTAYTLNKVIDSGYSQDGEKYIYLDVTIKNQSDADFEANALNNFYLTLADKSEITPHVKADQYGKKSVSGYEHLSGIPAGGEFSNYIGFCVPEGTDSFTVGFFATGSDINNKENAVFCEISSSDITSAPDGFING